MNNNGTSPLPNGRTDKNKKTSIKVLCVDDEASFLTSTKQLLEMVTPFHVDIACSVTDALEKLKSEVFDVVVSDYQMPEKSGLDFLKELRENNNDIPFILFTGRGREEVAVKALNLGADRYFNKFGNPETVYGQLVHGIRQAVAQRRAEKEVWDREERLRAIFVSSPDAMFTCDLNGIVTDCNLETLKLLGASSMSDVVGKHYLTFVVKEDKEKLELAFHEVLENSFVTNRETKLVTKSGTEVPIGFSASILRDAYGKPVGAVVLSRNITERKLMEQELKDSEEKYRRMVERTPDSIMTFDMNGVITSCNDASAAMSGQSKEELIGKHFSELESLSEKQVEILGKSLPSLLEGDIPKPFEIESKREDGTSAFGEVHVTLIKEGKKATGFQTITRDITARKRAEEKLRDSETKFRTISDAAQDSIILLNESGEIIYWNPAAEKTFGYTKEEAVGKELHSFFAPERFYEDYQKGVMKFKKTGQGSAIGKTLELFAKRKDGTEIRIELSLSALKIKGKWCATGIIRDITERKKAEGVLARERDTLEKVTGNLSASLAMISKDYRILWANNYTKNHMGNVTGKTCYESFNGLDHVCPGCKAEEVFKTGKQAVREQIVNNPKLGNIILNITSIPIKDENGNVTEILELAVDITERKKTEEKHLESEKRFRELAELLPEVIFEYDLNGNITYVNNEAYTRFGYSAEDFENGLNVIQFMAPECVDKAKTNIAKIVNGKRSAILEEYKLIRKDGSTFPAIITAAPISKENKIVGIRGVSVDITERKKTEVALHESEKRFRELSEMLPVIVFELDSNGKLTFVNREAYRKYGYSKEEFEKAINTLQAVVPEQQDRLKKSMAKLLSGETTEPQEYTLVRKDGTTLPIITHAAPIFRDGKVVGFRGISLDITEHKKAEAALRESEKRFRELSELLPAVIVEVDREGILRFANHATFKRFGYSHEEFEAGLTALQIIAPEDREHAEENIKRIMKGETVGPNEYLGLRKDGTTFPMIVNSVPIWRGDEIVGLRGIMVDITERKKVEDALAKERDTLEKVTGNLNTALLVISKDLHIRWVNKYLNNILGDVIGKLCYSALNQLDHVCSGCKIKEVIKTGKQATFEMVVPNSKNPRYPNGQDLFLEITAIPIRDKNGNVTEVLELALDITERRMMETAIREAEEQHKTLIDSAKVLITSVDEKGKYVYVNKEWKRAFGYTDEEIKKITIMDTVRSDHKKNCLNDVKLVSSGKQVKDIETVFVTKNGKEIHARGNATPIISNGKVISTVAVFLDITEHKKAENKVKETLKKLETLNEKLSVIGKLTRHDARNKLNVIATNTYLAKNKLAPNDNTLENLRDIESCISQMEKIFDFARNYELLGTEELFYTDVKKSFNEAAILLPCPNNIEPVTDCEGLKVRADSLLRQVFYNLIDNSAKYGETVTKIRVYCKEEPDGLKIVYEDNGIGIPAGEKEKIFMEGYGKGTGYGLYLIRKICENYGWTINEKGVPGEGTQFVMKIPKTDKNGKPNYSVIKEK
ncbi:MAG: hypothetical protein CW691_11105 [Candidatus Bathyarchaeum sp.]|nr:MAG: hypothetical protein CW691_11105 [Candidatus Bathyarchaeum sp.]